MTAALVVATALCWIATGYRLITTLRTPTLWSASFTGGVGFLAAGVSTFLLSRWINSATGVPNLAALLMHVLVGLAGGCVVLFVITLRHDHIRPRAILRTVLICLFAVVFMTITWLMSPFHDHEYEDLALAPLTKPVLAYFAIWYLYLVFVLSTAAQWCWRELRHPQPPPLRLGIRVIGVSTTLGAFSFAVAGLRIVLRYFTRQGWQGISAFMQVASAAAIAGIAVGTVIFLIGPRVSAVQRARTLERAFTPLARRVAELYPGVTVRSAALGGRTVRVQRLRTEILDGLSLLPVDSELVGDVEAIARALRSTPKTDAHRAADIIPTMTTDEQEDEWLLSLAHAFQRT